MKFFNSRLRGSASPSLSSGALVRSALPLALAAACLATPAMAQDAPVPEKGDTAFVLISAALKKGREHEEKKQAQLPKGKADQAEREMVANKGKGAAKPRDSAMESAALEAFDQMRASLAIDDEARAAA